MKRYKFNQLEIGKIYTIDAMGGWVGAFVGMKNDHLAEFQKYTYDDDDNLIPTDDYSYLTEAECYFDF